MLSKKPAILLSSYSNLSALYKPSSSQSTSPCPSTPLCRTYVTASQQSSESKLPSHDEAHDLHWPAPAHPHTLPSPYQILSCAPGTPYTKARFYALVKLYHPDRFHDASPAAALPQHTRLERYRLLVAAHALLSDPARRSAYDSHGAGWAAPPRSYTTPRKWPPGQDPMRNATWEDWERWHSRQNGQEPQSPVFASNFAFLSFIVVLACLGGVGQATRASNFSTSVLEQTDRKHREASRELMTQRRAAVGMDKGAQIQSLLRRAELDGYTGLTGHSVNNPERCSTETVRER
ncbi:uncharacterized protein BDZ99DRAFT_459478 [Mytilinidion resinicola]|uniref:J domain-containing protein n=1 Tax=Mytilinidion resinicola TaxID=574789 RepID=A0A6A6YY48_9PEZI|nr:uncharacterized protein BDZ99DRAFT_459478 [Mytilinidion resinicola]KAF2813700.1 hypothetical protein BDZ99DRAFT_459478 [Mytilinidion resinicola]